MAEKWVLYYHDNRNVNQQLYKCKLSTTYSFISDSKTKKACEIYFRGLPDDNVNQIINGDMKPLSENGLIIQITPAKKFSNDKPFYAIDLNKFAKFKKAATYKLKYGKLMHYLDEMIENNGNVQNWYNNLLNIAMCEKTKTYDMTASCIIEQFKQLSETCLEQEKFVKKAHITRCLLSCLFTSALCKKAVQALNPIQKNPDFVSKLTNHAQNIIRAQF